MKNCAQNAIKSANRSPENKGKSFHWWSDTITQEDIVKWETISTHWAPIVHKEGNWFWNDAERLK